jgi:hypothetical protein
MTEEWTMDENWIVHSRRNAFLINAVEAFIKKDDTNIVIFLHGPAIDVDLKNQTDRDEIWNFLIKCKQQYSEAIKRDRDKSLAVQHAALEIQNRMAGKIINHDH